MALATTAAAPVLPVTGRTAHVAAALQAAERDYLQATDNMQQILTNGLQTAHSAITGLQLSYATSLAAVNNAFARYREAVQQQLREMDRADP